MARGKLNYVVVAVDYFTKYVEVEALATIIVNKIIRFVYHTIFCRYGYLQKLSQIIGCSLIMPNSEDSAMITRF